jgi:hypothetical protein
MENEGVPCGGGWGAAACASGEGRGGRRGREMARMALLDDDVIC